MLEDKPMEVNVFDVNKVLNITKNKMYKKVDLARDVDDVFPNTLFS